MTFTVYTNQLIKQLHILIGAIPSSSTMPILQDFLFQITHDELILAATDLETYIRTVIPIEASDEGAITIPARTLLDILKILPDQPLEFEVDLEQFSISIHALSGTYKMPGSMGRDYPKEPDFEATTSNDIATNVLQEAIHYTLFSINQLHLRQAMQGLLFQLDGTKQIFVATDGYRLVKYEVDGDVAVGNAQYIIPKKSLQLLQKALQQHPESVHIAGSDTYLRFAFDGIQLIARLVDAKYPDYMAVIPKQMPIQVLVNRAAFHIALRRILVFSDKTNYHVALNISPNNISLFAEDLDFSNAATEQLECSANGSLKIAFNARFLSEFLNALQSEEVQLNFVASDRAGILRPVAQNEQEDILMLSIPFSN